MNKFLVSALASAGLMAAAAASQAVDITYYLVTPTYITPTAFPTQAASNFAASNGAGILTSNALFSNALIPSNPQPYAFGVGAAGTSVLSYGLDDTITEGTATASTSGTWSSVPISFEFYLDTKDDATLGALQATGNLFTVTGTINGNVGYNSGVLGESNASITFMSITDDTTGAVGAAATDPNDTSAAFEVATTVDGVMTDLYLDKSFSKPVPGSPSPFNVQGFIVVPTTSTPEPGSVATIVGMCVSGGLFLRRKRRA